MMYTSICLPVSLCQQHYPSKLILSNTHEQLHLTWSQLVRRSDVNRTYNSSANRFSFCFHNVTESFLFLEYCDILNGVPCLSGSTFCCNNWADFVSRTCVNVAGSRGKSYHHQMSFHSTFLHELHWNFDYQYIINWLPVALKFCWWWLTRCVFNKATTWDIGLFLDV